MSYTKSQALKLTKRIAYALRNKFGVGSSGSGKDVVSVIVSGQILSPILFYGIIAAGGVYSPSNLSSTVADLARQISQGESRLIVCSHDTKRVAVEAAKICGVPISRILLLQSKPVPRLMTLDDGIDVISDHELDWKRITDQEQLESTLACLLYSSGTSGLPKGTWISKSKAFPPSLIDVHSCPYLAPQSSRPDRPLRPTRSRASPNAQSTGPNPRLQDPRLPSDRPHRRPRLLLLLWTFPRRPRVLDAQFRLPQLPGISPEVPSDMALFCPSHLPSDCQIAQRDRSLRLDRSRCKRSRPTRPRPAVSSQHEAGKGQGSDQPGLGLERDDWSCYRAAVART